MDRRYLPDPTHFIEAYSARISGFLDANLGAAKGRVLAHAWKLLGGALFFALVAWRLFELRSTSASGARDWSETHGPNPIHYRLLLPESAWSWTPVMAVDGVAPPPPRSLESDQVGIWEDPERDRIWLEWGGTAAREGFLVEKRPRARKSVPHEWQFVGLGWRGFEALDSHAWIRKQTALPPTLPRQHGTPHDPREWIY